MPWGANGSSARALTGLVVLPDKGRDSLPRRPAPVPTVRASARGQRRYDRGREATRRSHRAATAHGRRSNHRLDGLRPNPPLCRINPSAVGVRWLGPLQLRSVTESRAQRVASVAACHRRESITDRGVRVRMPQFRQRVRWLAGFPRPGHCWLWRLPGVPARQSAGERGSSPPAAATPVVPRGKTVGRTQPPCVRYPWWEEPL